MKNSLNNLFVILFVLTVLLFTASESFAQRRVIIKPRTVIVKPVESRNYSSDNAQKAGVDNIIKRVETNLDQFVGLFDKSLDKSRLNGTKREDQLNRRAHDLERATDTLRSEFDRRDSWAENKSEVRTCLKIASDINAVIKSRRLGSATESKWVQVRNELNYLANAYNLPKVGSATYR